MTASKLDAALALSAAGFDVFPIAPGAKFPPLLPNWPEKATTEEATLRNWWTVNERANIGIHVGSKFVVLDVDVRSGGNATLFALDQQYEIPKTLTTLTPTGGRHLWFRLPEGHPGVKNGTGVLGAGIDVKGSRGYVVAAGSEVEAGRYRLEANVPIAPAPDWLVQKLPVFTEREQPTPSSSIPDAGAHALQTAQEWLKGRPVGDQAFATACGLRDFGLSQRQALALLVSHDGRDFDTLAVKVDHAYKFATGTPGAKVASPDDFPVVENTTPVEAPTPRSRPKLQRLLEFARIDRAAGPGYLVKGLLNRGAQGVLYGAPGEGKTFVALDLAYHVAAGRDWFGQRVRQGSVLYLAYEGMGGMVARGTALRMHYGDSADVPLYVTAADFNLREKEGRQALGALMGEMPEKPSLIIIDTLARAMKGGDENSAQDVGALMDAVGKLVDSTGAAVLLIHHSGKDKTKGARGSSALFGAIDTEIEVDDGRITPTKQRDMEIHEPWGFELQSMMVGIDEDNDEITSCVVKQAVRAQPKRVQLRGAAELAWGVLCEKRPNNDPITLEEWKQGCEEFLPQGANGRKAFYRAKLVLKNAGLIVTDDNGLTRRRLE